MPTREVTNFYTISKLGRFDIRGPSMYFLLVALSAIVAAQEASSNYSNLDAASSRNISSTSITSFNRTTSWTIDRNESATTRTTLAKTVYATLTYVTTSTNRSGLNSTSGTTTTSPYPSENFTTSLSTCPITSYARELPTLLLSMESDSCLFLSSYTKDQFFYNYADPCVKQYCSSSYMSALYGYSGTYPSVTSTFPYMNISWVNGSTEFGPLTTITTTFVGNIFDAVARTAPCCGACRIWASELQLLYWPEESTVLPTNHSLAAPMTGAFSSKDSFVDEAGFTFESPSVYMILSHLRAWDSCGPVGQDVTATTMAFDAAEISTLNIQDTRTTCPGGEAYFVSTVTTRRMTFADLNGNCSWFPGYTYKSDFPRQYMYSMDPCHPYIDIPSKVWNIHPLWKSCIPKRNGGFWDPPKTLRPAQYLVPSAIPSLTINAKSMAATPGSGPPVIAAPTSSRNAKAKPSVIASPSYSPTPTPVPIFVPVEVTLIPIPGGGGVANVITITPIWEAMDPGDSIVPHKPSSTKISNQVENGHPNSGDDDGEAVHHTAVSSLRDPQLVVRPVDGGLAMIVDGQTLRPGHTITIGASATKEPKNGLTTTSQTAIYLDQAAKNMIIDGTMTIPMAPTVLPQPARLTLRLGDAAYTADALGKYVVGLQTLIPGGFIVLDPVTSTVPDGRINVSGRQIVFLDPQGAFIVINGQTTMPLKAVQSTTFTGPSRVTVIEGQTFTVPVYASATVVVGGTTLKMLNGGTTVLGGKTVVLPQFRVQEGDSTDSATRMDTLTEPSATSRKQSSAAAEEQTPAKTAGDRDSYQHNGGSSARYNAFTSLSGAVLIYIFVNLL